MHTDQALEDPRLVGIDELRLGHLRGERCGGRSELVAGDVAGGQQRSSSSWRARSAGGAVAQIHPFGVDQRLGGSDWDSRSTTFPITQSSTACTHRDTSWQWRQV